MKHLLLLLCFVCALANADIPHARIVVELERDIRAETIALARERGEISAARTALAEELALREARVQQLRNDVENARRARRQGVEEAQRQRLELQTLRQIELDARAITREARRSLETRLPPGLRPELQERLSAIDASLAQPGGASAMQAAVELLDTFLHTNTLLNRPRRVSASAVRADGLELDGQALVLGPLSWFSSPDAGAGFLIDRPGMESPRFLPSADAGLSDWFQGEAADIPMDVSGGRALTLRAETRPWWDRLRDGGLTMIPLLLTAVASLVLVVWKTISLRDVRGLDPAAVADLSTLLREQDATAARERLASVPDPLRTLLEGAVAHPHADAEELEELMHERMLGLIPRLDRHLGTLAVLGGIAPLLGLLGTVTGMIHTFELVTLFGSGNERILSQGISEALVTTMSGLMIAVPVLLAHAFLSRRVRVILGELEQSIAAFIHARHHGEARP